MSLCNVSKYYLFALPTWGSMREQRHPEAGLLVVVVLIFLLLLFPQLLRGGQGRPKQEGILVRVMPPPSVAHQPRGPGRAGGGGGAHGRRGGHVAVGGAVVVVVRPRRMRRVAVAGVRAHGGGAATERLLGRVLVVSEGRERDKGLLNADNNACSSPPMTWATLVKGEGKQL